jgi:hypothetical protein
MIGKALKFPMRDNDAFRIYGLPKNMLVEVCLQLEASPSLTLGSFEYYPSPVLL